MKYLADLVYSLILNFPFMVALLSLVIAQSIKVIYYWIVDKKLDFWHLTEAGGMPSAHSAMVCSLVLSLGLIWGFSSPLFAIAFIFSIIVMYDAMGVRRATGKLGIALNQIIEEEKLGDEKFSEVMGHSPLEVIFGICLGLAITAIAYLIIY